MRKKKRRETYRSYRRVKPKRSVREGMFKFIKLLLLMSATGFVIYYFVFRKEQKPPETLIPTKKVEVKPQTKAEAVDLAIDQILAEFNIPPSWITKKEKTHTVRIPRDVASILLIHKMIKRIEDLDCKLLKSSEDLIKYRSTLEIGYKDELIRQVILNLDPNLIRNRGKIAIIIDDFGYSEDEGIQKLLAFPYPITISVIPGLARSQAIYQLAQTAKKETIIHLPMEAVNEKVEYTEYTIFSNMSDEEITQRVKKAIQEFPNSRGLNNHMGSKITADKRVMRLILQELQKADKYFIDSKTTVQSVAFKMAKELKVPSSENNIFLERERNDTEDYLRKKLEALSKIAEKNGFAVAIGHPYENTINVLTEEIPKLESQGFNFIPASETVSRK